MRSGRRGTRGTSRGGLPWAMGWLGLSAALGAALLAPRAPTLPDDPGPARWPSGPGAYPSQWFLGQRMSAGEPIPVEARRRALADLSRTDGAATGDAPGVWVNEGPLNIGGRITALAVDPNDASHVWFGAADGGVWSTSDGGTTWTPHFDDQTTLAIGALAAHPTDSSILYVGTGEDNGGGFSYPGDGVYKTVDGGATWSHLGLAETRRIGRIAVDPVTPDRVFVAAGGDVFVKNVHRGIYRSTDGGATWSNVLFVADDSGAIDVAIDPSDPNRVYAAIWQRHSFAADWYIGGANSGVWRSLDGGDTWTRLGGGLPSGANVGRIGLAIAASSPQTVYALVIGDNARLLGVYRSLNGGDSWTKRDSPFTQFLFGGFSYYFGNIRVDPTNANVVYALDVQLLRSTNGGQNFGSVTNGMHVDFHDLVLGPGANQYAGNDGGYYFSTDSGASWTHVQTLPITQFYDIGIDTLNPNNRFGGAQDNGTNRTQTGGLSDWTNVLGGDGMECEVDPTDSNKVYAESQFGNIARSTDGGDTFVSATNGIDGSERANWVTPITIDPTTPTTLYTGYQRVYRSIDSAVNWTAISPNLTDLPFGGEAVEGGGGGHDDPGHGTAHTQSLIRSTITAVAVSAVDDQIVWAGTDDGNVWVTDDGGAGWTEVTPPGLDLWVTDIQCDPFDARTAYLSVSGYRAGDRLPYVRKTVDLGASWQDIAAGLPQVPVSTIVTDPANKGQLFVGSDVAVHLTDDGGATWQTMSGGIPILVMLDLWLHDPGRTLYAGTHGRSIYSFDLTQLPPPDRDADGVVNVDDCAPEDGGAFAVPAEVSGLAVDRGPADSSELSWSSLAAQAGPAVVYDVATGTLAQLVADGGTGGSVALACGVGGLSASDPAVPGVGAGVYYLVRGANVCGKGSWGTDSTQAERSSPACP